MRRVVIESPYRGDVDANLAYLGECIRDCLSRGEAPIASHGLFTRWLDDDDEWERRIGIAAGLAWHAVADAVVIYGDLGVSGSMVKAIDLAESLGVKVIWRKIR